MPQATVVRVWRELISAATLMQGPYSVSIYGSERTTAYWDLARFYLGAATPLSLSATADDVLQAVAREAGRVGLLPAAAGDDILEWPGLLASMDDPKPRIISRLPFVLGAADPQEFPTAYVVAMLDPEPSGDDTTVAVVTGPTAVNDDQIEKSLQAEGLDVTQTVPAGPSSSDSAAAYLCHIAGLVTPDDQRLTKASGTNNMGVTVLGAFANPIFIESAVVGTGS